MLATLPTGLRDQNINVAHSQIGFSQRASLEECPGLSG